MCRQTLVRAAEEHDLKDIARTCGLKSHATTYLSKFATMTASPIDYADMDAAIGEIEMTSATSRAIDPGSCIQGKTFGG